MHSNLRIRKARITDVEGIHKLVNTYARQGLMLPRSLSLLYESLRDFVVADEEGEIIGTGALHILWKDLAEIQAVAVRENHMRKGIGSELVGFLLKEAQELDIPRVFALTYRPSFFQRLGFRVIPKEALPQKVWKDCINCPRFPNCDEVALIRDIEPPP